MTQTAGIPPAEVEIDESLIRRLLRSQHRDLADLRLRHAATGWDNTTYRLGDDLAVRLPRIEDAVALLRNEQRWLPVLAGELPVPVPTPVRVGTPGCGYPWPWSVVPWLAGRSAEYEPLAPDQASAFGSFLAAVHRRPPPGFPRNDYRGVPLTTCTGTIGSRLERLAAATTGLQVPLDAVRERWLRAVEVPADVTHVRIHGDLHPKNIVVDGGRLASVIDWGDMTAGDPATDLGAAWMLFPTRVLDDVWDAYGPISERTMRRAAGWAVFFGVVLLDTGLAGDPPFAALGRRTLERVCAP